MSETSDANIQVDTVAIPPAAPESLLLAPRGLEQIVATFGDIYEYIRPGGNLDPRWQAEYLDGVQLPFPLALSWDRSRSVRRMTCHKMMTGIFASAFGQVQARGLESKITSFGGCFAFRRQRTGARLSSHSWGIAIDLNPETNGQGSQGSMDAGLIEIFRQTGFEWGGDWSRGKQDWMHFQFCSKY